MNLARCGEDALIATLTRRLELGAKVRVGPGDDCAVLGAPRAIRWQLLKSEAVVEGVHFLSNDDPRRVGWKAFCRAVSDVAAMGGVPEHALVTLAVSR
ncbi:MAG TPA: AIR synthase related protein, partial [Chthoniobacteraceae bacterium]|nr:AIR synthase related protein [Chthoniobacteraceae bacterium]